MQLFRVPLNASQSRNEPVGKQWLDKAAHGKLLRLPPL